MHSVKILLSFFGFLISIGASYADTHVAKEVRPRVRKVTSRPLKFDIKDYDIPTSDLLRLQRDEERWDCLETSGEYTRPRVPNPDGGEPLIDEKKMRSDLLQIYPPGVNGCKSSELLISRSGERIDLKSCSESISILLEQAGKIFLQSKSCLRKRNSELYEKIVYARKLSDPKWSCVYPSEELSPAQLSDIESTCRSRLSSTARPGAAERCVQLFKENNRVVFFHPVFPDRGFLRISKHTNQVMANPSIIARILFREEFVRIGYDADGEVTDGCLGMCGPLPDVVRLWSEKGCNSCMKAEGGREWAPETCHGIVPPDVYVESLSEYQNYLECYEGMQQGDSLGLHRACTRLMSGVNYRKVCRSDRPTICLKSNDLRRNLEDVLKYGAGIALRTFEKLPEWRDRSRYSTN